MSEMRKRSKQAVIAMATRYGVAELKSFIISLRNTGFEGDIILFVRDLKPGTDEFLANNGVLTLPFPHKYFSNWRRNYFQFFTKYFTHRDSKEKLWYLADIWMVALAGRFFTYRKALENWTDRYDEVLFTDVRDVIFQANPFNYHYGTSIALFAEATGRGIGQCRANSRWIRDGYGDKPLEEMKDKDILCAGVMYTRGDGIMRLMKAMTEELLRINPRDNLDQGVLNYLAYKQKLGECKIFSQVDAPIMHIGCNNFSTLKFDEKNRVLNGKGEVAAVVHQYDRHPQLSYLAENF